MEKLLVCGRVRRAVVVVAALLALGGRPALAWNSPAPDVVVYSTPALAAVAARLGVRFTQRSRVAVHVFVAPPDGLVGLVRHRARADVVLADAVTVRAMAAAGLVRAASVVGLGGDPFVLVGRAGAGLPAGASAAQLVAGHRTVLPDDTSAGSFDGAAVLRAALVGGAPVGGPPTPMDLFGVSDTPTVVDLVRGDARLIGLVHRSEASQRGIVQVAALPGPATAVSGGLVSGGQSARAGDFLGFVAGTDGMAMLRDAGLEPVS